MLHHHHHLAASAEIELTTPFQYSLLVISVRMSSLGLPAYNFWKGRDRLCDDGCLQRTKDEISSSEARAKWPRTGHISSGLGWIFWVGLHRCLLKMDDS